MAEDRTEHRAMYEQWVRSHARELYGFSYRLTGDHSLAEDLVQECFAEAWRSMASLREPERARSWLFQILRHRCSRQFQRDQRQKSSHGTVALPQDSDQHPPTHAVDPGDAMADREAIQVALEQLSVDLRQTFLMVTVEQLTCRETAAQLNIPLGTVLSRLDRARRLLRDALTRSEKRAPLLKTAPKSGEARMMKVKR